MVKLTVSRPVAAVRERCRSLSWKQIGLAMACVISICWFVIFGSPAATYHRIVNALEDVFVDFKVDISVDINDCGIILWTRKSQHKHERLSNLTRAALDQTSFNRSHDVKILIHGFSDGPSTMWTRHVKSRYLEADDYNIFSLDWELLAQSPWYSTAVKNAETAGLYGSYFTEFLTSPEVGYSYSDLHVIGASLGAQVAGLWGYFAQGRIGRITGLDPSGPLFHSVPKRQRLDASDAVFVDVIHSAGRWVGNDEIIGHVDFFPNLGKAPQPGCAGEESFDLTCSHFKSWQMFAQSIIAADTSDDFVGLRCSSDKDFLSGKCCDQALERTAVSEGGTDNNGMQPMLEYCCHLAAIAGITAAVGESS